MDRRRRHAFRPAALETMEDRLVLSGAASALVHIALIPPVARGLKLGALGDSSTDEYKFNGPDRGQARNWVEILAAARRIHFGAFTGAHRPAPRNQGFANNWATSGATTDDVITSQLPGLADQVRKGQVNTVVIFIGATDYLKYLAKFQAPFSIPPADPVGDLAKIEARAEDNLTTAVRTLLVANPNAKLVLTTVPDLRTLPVVSSMAQNPLFQPLGNALATSINQYNQRIKGVAAGDSRVAVADLASEFQMLAQQAARTGTVSVGNQQIDLRTVGDEYHHFFLADGIHLGTIGQASLASLYVQTIDNAFNQGIKPLSAPEVLRIAQKLPAR